MTGTNDFPITLDGFAEDPRPETRRSGGGGLIVVGIAFLVVFLGVLAFLFFGLGDQKATDGDAPAGETQAE